MMDTVLILGMGYLGRPLATQLVATGTAVIGTYACTEPSDVVGIQVERCDISEMAQGECPTHWQAAKTWVCLLPPSCSVDYVSALKKWLSWAEQYHIKQIIYTSSTSVFSQREGIVDEQSTTMPMTESAQKIVAVEQAILQSGVPHKTILRLAGLFDQQRHPVYRLAQRTEIDNGQQRINMVHREDAVAALLHAIHTPEGTRLRHIVHPSHPTREQFYQQQAALLGVALPSFQEGGLTGKIVQTIYQDFPIPCRGIDS